MSFKKKELEAFERLLKIMDELREKCPWDQKQTMKSLRPLTIEETYELAEAILMEDSREVKKELGDLLLHIVFYAKIGSEDGAFDITDVITGICDKLIERHPHIYGAIEVADEEEVRQNWEKIKLKEGRTSVLEGVPNSLPAMIKAQRIQEKTSGVGFDWENAEQVVEKIEEELEELKTAIRSKNEKDTKEELGDLLFSTINLSRFLDVVAENALELTNKKFIRRFRYIEEQAKQSGKQVQDLTLTEMESYWQEAKTL